MGLLSPYLNVAGTAQVKVKALLELQQREGEGEK